MDAPTPPEKVTILVRRLVDQLRGRGFPAEPIGANMVWIATRTPGITSPAAVCRNNTDGRLGWWWVRINPDGNPEHEWICPAIEITMAANAIIRLTTPPRNPEGAGR